MSRTVFSIDTEHDKNLYALARTAAQCRLRSCNIPCENCDTFNRWSYCYNELAECDKLRVDSMTEDLVAQAYYVHQLAHYKQRAGMIHGVQVSIRKVIMILVVMFFLSSAVSVLFMFIGCSRPAGLSIDNKIANIVRQMPRNIPDINRDEENDCIDRAIAFKILWDSTYSEECELVRNYNTKYKLHHLYCRVYDERNNVWVKVEPDRNQYSYKVEDVWGSKYDPSCDIYGETYRWMKEVVYGKCSN